MATDHSCLRCISAFHRTPEDAKALPRIVTVVAAILQTVQDHSLTPISKGDLIDRLTSYQFLRLSGITTHRSARLVSPILSELACYKTPSDTPTASWPEQAHRCHG